MSEDIMIMYCEVCDKYCSFIVSGSGKKCTCLECGTEYTIEDEVVSRTKQTQCY